MACNPDFVQYILDQCSGAGEIAVKKMMGDYCAYCDGILFGLICDNNFYVKVTEPGRVVLKEAILRPPYDGANDYFYISDVDDREYLTALIKATIPALPKPHLSAMLNHVQGLVSYFQSKTKAHRIPRNRAAKIKVSSNVRLLHSTSMAPGNIIPKV